MASQHLQWADMPMNPKYGTEHFLVAGATGSGKTILINLLMKSVLEAKRSSRAMVYDPKQEVLPTIYALLGLSEEDVASGCSPVRVLHPLDERCCAWDLASDFDGPVSARQFASILVPDGENEGAGDSFFTNAVRDLLTGVMLAFINCVPAERAWTFRDVLLTLLYEPYLRFVLEMDKTREGKSFPMVARLRESYLDGDTRTASNIRATINTKLSIYEPIAATWHLAQIKNQTFSLSEWVSDDPLCSTLVLGNDEASRSAIDAINQAVFKRASELLLAKREATKREREDGLNQTWFFLDEVREAGRLDGLSRLLTKGRSKGACVVLGFQDIAGMRAVYGDEVANEICGQCNNVAILRLNSASTAEWAVELFGRRLALTEGGSRSVDSEGRANRGRDTGDDERPYVYTSNFLYLPQTSEANGLSGYFRSPNINPEEHELGVHLPWSEIAPLLPQVPDVREDSMRTARKPRPVAEHYLEPWSEADRIRLGFKCALPPWKSKPSVAEQAQNVPRRSVKH